MFKSIIMAFEMYSRVPMPRIDWDDKSMKYMIGWFPLVGVLIGGLEFVWLHFAMQSPVPSMLKGAAACVLPLLITGGIHMDGYCDTIDALSSFQPRERKLEILKDSNSGAFAIIYAGIYLVMYFACASSIYDVKSAAAIAFGFVSSRALSALALNSFKAARENGMLKSTKDTADRGMSIIMLSIWLVIAAAGMIYFGGLRGVFALAAQLLVFVYYRIKAYKQFGGITGDTAGWFLQLAELWSLIVLAFWEVFVK